MQTFQNIQGLRFVAALSVVLFHCDGFYREARGVPISQTFEYVGYSGVDIFFAISGAVMVLSTSGRVGAGSAARFLYARFVRVMPIYWIMLALMWIVAWFLHRDYLQTKSMMDAFLLWPTEFYVVPDAWTLTYEMIFYAIFAGLLLFPFSWRFAAIVVLSAASVLICATSGTRSLHPFLSVIFFLEFFGGCAAAFLLLAVDGRGFRSAIAIGVALFAAAVVLQFRNHEVFVEWKRVLAFGSGSVAIVYGLLGCEARWRAIFPRQIVHAGDWSYSIYLFHPVALFFFYGLGHIVRHRETSGRDDIAKVVDLCAVGLVRALDTSALTRSATVLLAFASILVLSFAISVWIELPLYAALKALPSRLKSAVAPTRRDQTAPQVRVAINSTHAS